MLADQLSVARELQPGERSCLAGKLVDGVYEEGHLRLSSGLYMHMYTRAHVLFPPPPNKHAHAQEISLKCECRISAWN